MAARLTTYLVVGIVAATFIAGLIVGAQRDDPDGPVDLIVHNARLYTADEGARAEAVAIRGNQILRIGSNREIGRLRRPQTAMIDAGGATVLPGFNDSNVRLVEGGLALLREGREPDGPGADAPVATREDRLEAVQAAIAEAHRLGITSVHDLGATPADVAMYDELRRSGELALRVYAALELEGPYDENLLFRLAAIWKDFSDDPRFKTGAVALALDGDVESHTAAMLEPYATRPAVVEPAMDADELNRFVRLLDEQGWQILALAQGDRAVRMALDAYRHAERSNRVQERSRRHRIEGAATIDETDLPRFATLGVIASVQPVQAELEPHALRGLVAALGPERALSAWPLATLDASAAPLAFGSGWPAAPLDPMLGLHAAVTRTAADGRPEGGWNRAERLKLETAVDAYTAGGAYASFDEQRKGTITPGMLADLVVLTGDIFTAPAVRLPAAEVAVTIFDGKVVYLRDPKTTD